MGFTQQFKATVPEFAQARILKALRQEPIIWQALSNARFAEKVFSFAKGNPNRWNPAIIGLIAMDDIALAERFEEDLMVPLDTATRQKAAAKLAEISQMLNQQEISISLADCALIALSIRERWRLIGNWDEILADLSIAPIRFWQPIFTCVYGLLPHPENLVAQLISPKTNETYQYLAIHTVLSNPIELSQKSDILKNLLSRLSAEQQIKHLERINIFSQSLGETIAKELQSAHADPSLNSAHSLEQVKHYLEQAEYHKLAGSPDQSLPLMEKAWQQYTQYHTDLVTQLALSAAKQNNEITARKAIENAEKIAPAIQLSPYQENEESNSTVIENQSLWEINSLIDKVNLLIGQKEFDNASELAMQVYSDYQINRIGIANLQIKLDLTFRLIQIFNNLSLTSRSVSLAEDFLDLAPNNLTALNCLIDAHQRNKDIPSATQVNLLAITLFPTDKSLRSSYISNLIDVQDWEEAKNELLYITQHFPNPEVEDITALIDCAIYAKDYQEARKACYTLLETQPESIHGYTKLGEINLKLSNIDEGIKYLEKSINLNPSSPTPWILLSQHYASIGDVERATTELDFASKKFNNHPEIDYAKGLLHQSLSDNISAQTHFEMAFNNIASIEALSKQTIINIHSHYGKILIDIGELEKAHTLLENSYHFFEHHPQIAYPLGKVKLALGLHEEALQSLTISYQHHQTHLDIQLCLVETYLALEKYPTEALDLAQNINQTFPELVEGKFFLAQAHQQANQFDLAFPLYQELITDPEFQSFENSLQVLCGFADVAIGINSPELALIPLKESLTTSDNAIIIQKKLAEVYLAANLPFETIKMLEILFREYENDVEMILWISDLAIEIDNLDLAIQSLTHGLTIAPDSAEILIRLGYAQINLHKYNEARASFLKLMDLESILPTELEMAAKALKELGDIDKSIPLLEKAAEIDGFSSTSLLKDLTALYLKTNQHKKAISTLEKHIALENENIELHLKASEVYIQLDNQESAIKILRTANLIEPGNAKVNHQLAILLRSSGNPADSLSFAEKALIGKPDDEDVQLLVAEINFSMLNDQRAFDIIQKSTENVSFSRQIFHLELLAHLNNIDDVTQIIAKMTDADKNTFLGKAFGIMSLAANRDFQNANSHFIDLLNIESEIGKNEISAIKQAQKFRILSMAAVSIQEWELAIQFAKKALTLVTNEPINSWNYAKILVLQAEYQNFANAFEITHRTPGNSAYSAETQELFGTLIDNCLRICSSHEIKEKIAILEKQGKLAISTKSPEKISFTPKSSFEANSWMAACNRVGLTNIGLATCKPYLEDHSVLLQFALGLLSTHPNQTIEYLRIILSKNQNNAPALFLLAKAANKIDNLKLAEQSIIRALAIENNEAHWHTFASQIFEKTNRFGEALDYAKKAVSLSPEHASHHHQVGHLSMILGQTQQAMQSFLRATDLQSQETVYWQALANAYFAMQQFDLAANAADELISLNPGRIESIILRSRIAIENNKVHVAEKFIEQAININADHPLILKTQAQVFTFQNRTEEAISLLEKASELTMNPVPILVEKAALLRKTRGLNAQLTYLTELETRYPTNAEVLSALANALFASGRLSDAIQTSEEALKSKDNNLSVKQKIQLHCQLGSLLQQANQFDSAIDHLTIAIQYNPNLVEAHLSLGEAYENHGNKKMALTTYENCISLSPKDALPYQKAGNILKEFKKYSEAETMFRKASGLAPHDHKLKGLLSMTQALLFIHKPKEVSVYQ